MRTVIMSVHFYRTTGCHIRKTTFLIPSWEPQTSLTNSMEQSPFWEATQEIPRVLCNPKVHYRIYKSPPPVPILRHINPVHASPSLFLIIIFNIILLPTIRSSKSSLSFGFPIKILYACLPYVPRDPPISFFLIWSHEWYLMRSTEHKAPRYVVFSVPLSPRPS